MVLPSSGAGDGAASAAAAQSTAIVARPKRRLGEVLVERGDLTQEQLDAVLTTQKGDEKHHRLGEMLVVNRAISPRVLVEALAEQYDLGSVSLIRSNPDSSLTLRLERELADQLDVVPYREVAGVVEVAIADPTIGEIAARLEVALGAPVTVLVANPEEVRRAREQAYTATEGMGAIVQAFEARSRAEDAASTTIQVDENAPIVQVVTRIISQAVADQASDVHVEPMEDRVRVRNRIDGALKETLSLPSSMAQALSSRIKIMAGLNIVERRRPQDGQIETTVDGRVLDIRVSTTGTMFGESIVLRILDRQRALYGLHDLGMPEDVESRYREVIQSPYGLVVCAGPTGSGKTTTLYTTLQTVKSDEINVMTVEDPVEYVFPDINQIPINEQAGLTFASGLRSILRQDPDTILVGEIRDVETARIAIQAALTGHFVLSTVHATDAASALHRFIDMGIEPFLLASSLLATVGQRLVRQNCSTCIESYAPPTEELAFYERAGGQKADGGAFRRGSGCEACAGTGYKGRIGVYEVLRVTDAIRDRLVDHAQADEVRRLAIDDGMVTMQARAIDLVDEGQTTIAEVMRTVYVL